jgi:hypothetical protein
MVFFFIVYEILIRRRQDWRCSKASSGRLDIDVYEQMSMHIDWAAESIWITHGSLISVWSMTVSSWECGRRLAWRDLSLARIYIYIAFVEVKLVELDINLSEL